jgi:hypothetical protein
MHDTAAWNEVTRLLREARQYLAPERSVANSSGVPVGQLTGTLEEFDEFVEQNELELAWDALATVARRRTAPLSFWRNLARAAALMQLPDKEKEALQRSAPVISCDQALTVAKIDAERVYPDLLAFRITVVFEDDGWHIDYTLKDTRMNGGGPHYVIDAMSGKILSKRYEQ